VLVKENYKESTALMVYHMETYKVLKAFEYSKGRCMNLITNEYVVVQLQRDQHLGIYVLIYDKKMLLDLNKTVEDVKMQRIQINHYIRYTQFTRMSINTTSLVFAQDTTWGQKVEELPGLGLSVLNFWVGKEKVAIKEECDENGQAEKKAKRI